MIEEAYGHRRCRLLGLLGPQRVRMEMKLRKQRQGMETDPGPIVQELPETKFSPVVLSYTTLRLINFIFY